MKRSTFWLAFILFIVGLIFTNLAGLSRSFLKPTLEPYATMIYIATAIFGLLFIGLTIAQMRGKKDTGKPAPEIKQRATKRGEITESPITADKDSGVIVDVKASGKGSKIKGSSVTAKGSAKIKQHTDRGGKIEDSPINIE